MHTIAVRGGVAICQHTSHSRLYHNRSRRTQYRTDATAHLRRPSRTTRRKATVVCSTGNGNGNGTGTSGDSSSHSQEYMAPLYSWQKGIPAKGFVEFFRQASPYVQSHRRNVFLIVIPGSVVQHHDQLDSLLRDVTIMHGLGVQVVLVVGCSLQIDRRLREKGLQSEFQGGYRVTDTVAMALALESAGATYVEVTSRLSRGPSITQLRRHGQQGRGGRVTSGNFVAAKRRGIVNGVDFKLTGDVRSVDTEGIQQQLDLGNIVLLSNMGYTAAGETLNCNTYEVAAVAAQQLQADKVVCMMDSSSFRSLWEVAQHRDLTLTHAERILNQYCVGNTAPGGEPPEDAAVAAAAAEAEAAEATEGPASGGAALEEDLVSQMASYMDQPLDELEDVCMSWSDECDASWLSEHHLPRTAQEARPQPEPSTTAPDDGNRSRKGWDGAQWQRFVGSEAPLELCLATAVCSAGVRRAHLVDNSVEGALLLEAYTRDGIGVMVYGDQYEGVRKARMADVRAIKRLLAPLEADGTLKPRTTADIIREVPNFMVMERDGYLVGCAALHPFPEDYTAEVAAFAVSPVYRGSGRGDRLLSELERYAKAAVPGCQSLFLLTTRTMDWFQQRGFGPAGAGAALQDLLPRGKRVDAKRNSQMFVKVLQDDEEQDLRPFYQLEEQNKDMADSR